MSAEECERQSGSSYLKVPLDTGETQESGLLVLEVLVNLVSIVPIDITLLHKLWKVCIRGWPGHERGAGFTGNVTPWLTWQKEAISSSEPTIDSKGPGF